MALRELLSIEAVLQALDADDSCSESEDEFDGYIGEDEYEEERRARQFEEYDGEGSGESGENDSDNESVEAMDTDQFLHILVNQAVQVHCMAMTPSTISQLSQCSST
jgi:hypothetical protein